MQILPPAPGPTPRAVADHGARHVQDTAGKHYRSYVDQGAAEPRKRAQALWNTLNREHGIAGKPGMYSDRPRSHEPTTVWPQSQVIAASLDMASVTGESRHFHQAMHALEHYYQGGAYAPFAGKPGQARFYDDNTWIGLDAMQGYLQSGDKNTDLLHRAEDLFHFIKSGMTPEGLLKWKEHESPPELKPCVNGPAIELATKLYQATGDRKYLDFASKLHVAMDRELLDRHGGGRGLYVGRVAGHEPGHEKIWSYNQGAAIGADLALYKATGKVEYASEAKRIGQASLAYFGEHRLEEQGPMFNAIYFRNLLKLDQVAPDPRYRESLASYVGHVWSQGHDARIEAPGKHGHLELQRPGLEDQAGLVQLHALLAMTSAQIAKLS